jgi:hypothetical protein
MKVNLQIIFFLERGNFSGPMEIRILDQLSMEKDMGVGSFIL